MPFQEKKFSETTKRYAKRMNPGTDLTPFSANLKGQKYGGGGRPTFNRSSNQAYSRDPL